jgi:GTP-binding protein Era
VPSSAPHRSGFVAICGRPNVGKSTLLNALLGEPVAVATPYPQTTRERLLGIWTEAAFQAVLVDTPGIHRARSALNEFMVRQAVAAARDVDLVLLLDEAPAFRDAATAEAWQPGEVALSALQMLAPLGHPIVLVLTKVDRLRDRSLLLPVLANWGARHEFAAIVPTAALQGEGLDTLRNEVVQRLPEGPQLYPPEDLSDRGMRWHAAELVRAELFEHLGDELPYSCAVRVDRYEHKRDRDRIVATIFVERDSQKGMVIGKGGRVVGAVRTGAQARIERLAGRPCELHLSVEVAKNWTKDPSKLERLGYRDPGGGS